MANMNKDKLKLSKPIRVPVNIIKDLDTALNRRLNNKLITRKEANYPEALRLMGRNPEWKQLLDKLSVFPRREDKK